MPGSPITVPLRCVSDALLANQRKIECSQAGGVAWGFERVYRDRTRGNVRLPRRQLARKKVSMLWTQGKGDKGCPLKGATGDKGFFQDFALRIKWGPEPQKTLS